VSLPSPSCLLLALGTRPGAPRPVAAVAYELDSRTDARRRMTMYYPLHRATLLIELRAYKAQEASGQGSALSHVPGPDQLLPAYRPYQLLAQR
jgi:hypothetical protein